MAHSNIYIRKDNEARWANITDKSAWVNAYLEKSPPNSIVESKHLEPEPMELCKNGHAVFEGKCMGKQCKYAI